MDIAKIRKKLKRGGRSKKPKGADERETPPPSTPPDVSSSDVGESAGKIISPPQEAMPLEDSLLVGDTANITPAFVDEDEEDVPVMELLTFKVSGQTYAFRVEDIQEILRNQTITPVPGTAPFLSGITSLRGTIIPVMDMGRRLVMDKKYDYGNKAKIVVLYGPKGSIGVLLDSAVKVLTVAVTSVDWTYEGLSEEEMRFISGVTRDNGRLVFIIDVKELFHFSGEVEAR
jgi:purine-binding chemotaxis protein CheW